MSTLTGFAFRGYRSFPSGEIAGLAPLSKINLIAGQNNTGKSNILRVLAETYTGEKRQASRWDRPLGDAEHQFARMELCFVEEFQSWVGIDAITIDELKSVLDALRIAGLVSECMDRECVWIPIAAAGEVAQGELTHMAQQVGNAAIMNHLSMKLTHSGGGGHGDDALRVLRWLMALKPPAPTAYTIGGVRAISERSEADPDLNGQSIKRRLLELQNPSSDRLADREKFLSIQDFVRAVLDDASVTIDVPHDLSTIHVTQRGQTLPIEYLGTGVHEVVIIAAAATVIQNALLCIEEPEVHLHPVLQRKLLRYLSQSTTNQYVIATHSAHMLDSELGSIFHVVLEGGRSKVQFAGTARQRAAVCADLGYRPSDLVQTNAVIWVEGPSDRVYLRSWIEKLAPARFLEGTHYSIMFYGGSLLNELSPLDVEEVDEFISLRALNRYMAILIDSDRRSRGSSLNASKRRVIAGLAEDPATGVAWVTAGYTIENYVPDGVLSQAIQLAHPSTRQTAFTQQDRWQNPLTHGRIGIRQPSKVAIAKRAVEVWGSNEWPLDLRRRTQSIVDLIERANAHL